MGAGHGTRRHRQLGQANRRYQRGILQQRHRLVHQRRYHAAQRLRQHHIAHGLHLVQAQAFGGLDLATGNRLDAGTHDLGNIGAGIQRQRQCTGKEGAMRLAEIQRGGTAEQQTVLRVNQCRHQRKMHQQNLHEQRCAAQKADIAQQNPAQHAAQAAGRARVDQADAQPQQQPQRQRNQRQLHGHPGPGDEQGRIGRQNFPA